jgi:hypothetical protein
MVVLVGNTSSPESVVQLSSVAAAAAALAFAANMRPDLFGLRPRGLVIRGGKELGEPCRANMAL